MKALACLLTLALATSVTAAPTAGAAVTAETGTAETGTESAADMSTLQKILKENHESLFNLPEGKQMRIETIRIQEDADLAVTYASALAKKAGLKSIKYHVEETLNPVILTTLVKQELKLYAINADLVNKAIPASFTVKNVKAMKKNNNQLVVKQKNGKKITYLTFTGKSGKIKNGVIYTKSGKTYKKNKKKISKKKFNNYVKKFNKLKNVSMKKADAMDPDYYSVSSNFIYKNDEYCMAYPYATVKFVHEPTDKTDEYKLFEEDQTAAGSKVFRFILAPNIPVSGSSVTYQQAMWENTLYALMDLCQKDAILNWYELETGTCKLKSGTVISGLEKTIDTGETVKVSRYTLLCEKDNAQIVIDVFEEGDFKGKIMSYEYGEKGKKPECYCIFWYDDKAEYDGQLMDPLAYTMCYQSGSISPEAPKHKLTINYTGKNPEIKTWTVESDGNVAFFLPPTCYKEDKLAAYCSGFSYLIDGKEVLYPASILDKEGYEVIEKGRILGEMLNKKDKNGNYIVAPDSVDAFFWDESKFEYVIK